MNTDLVRPTNICQLLSRGAEVTGDRPCLFWGDEQISYGSAAHRVAQVVAGLDAVGVARGDCIAIAAGNSDLFIYHWLAVAYVGAILLPINPDSSAQELARLVAQSRPRLVLTDEETWPAVAGVVTEVRPGTPCHQLGEFLHSNAGPLDAPRGRLDDVVALIPTSGTTSRPKLVMQTQRALLLAAEGFPSWLGLSSADRLLTCLPLFHINALVYSTLGAFSAGASLAILPRFSARTFWAQACDYGATEFNAIAAMVEILMRSPTSAAERDNAVRLCYYAPAPSKQRHRQIEDRFGLRLMCGYGMSESLYGTIWPLAQPTPYGSMGRLRQHPSLGEINFAKIVDEQGMEVAPGAPGELLLQNPSVTRGYFEDADATDAALAGGWLRTGDLVRRDAAGFYFFVGRKKEMIRRRGHNVAPSEIEDVLRLDHRVVDAAVIGVPSELSEEDIEAYVTLAPPSTASEADLLELCRKHLSRQKIPSRIIELAELPRTPTGRIAKHLLRPRTSTEGLSAEGNRPAENSADSELEAARGD